MFTVNAVTQAALLSGRSIERQTIVQAINPTSVSNISIFDDNAIVSYSMGQQVGRTCAFAVARDVFGSGVLNTLTSVIYVHVTLGHGLEMIPLFMGRIVDTVEDDNGHVVVRCSDFGDDLIHNDFRSPWASKPQGTTVTEIRGIIFDADSSLALTIESNVLPQPVPDGSVWERSRGQALDDIAQGAACLWQADRSGGFTLYHNPFSASPIPTPVMTLSDGVNGVLVRVNSTRSRAGMFNMVTLVVERDVSATPFVVVVADRDPLSPTYYGGPFGRRNRTLRVQLSIGNASAQALALQLLRQSLSLAETWSVTIPFMPLLDQGDVVLLAYRGVNTLVVVESVDIPLRASEPTTLTCRKLLYIDPASANL